MMCVIKMEDYDNAGLSYRGCNAYAAGEDGSLIFESPLS